MKMALKIFYVFGLILVLKVKCSTILIFNVIFLCRQSAKSLQKKSLKNIKMGDKLLLMPYFDNFVFDVLYILKMHPNFDV